MNCPRCGAWIAEGRVCTFCGGEAVSTEKRPRPPVIMTVPTDEELPPKKKKRPPEVFPRREIYPVPLRSRPILGSLGALLGAIPGTAALVLLERVSWLSFLGGIALGMCVLGFCRWLGRGYRGASILTCVIILLTVPGAIGILGQSMQEKTMAFTALPVQVRLFVDLGQRYLFTLVGALLAGVLLRKKKKKPEYRT